MEWERGPLKGVKYSGGILPVDQINKPEFPL